MSKNKHTAPNYLVSFFTKNFQISHVDKSNLEEKKIVNFSSYQVLTTLISVLFFLFIITLVTVVFLTTYTPLNKWLPQVELSKKQEVFDLLTHVDSLEEEIRIQSQYIGVINKILDGEVVDSFVPLSLDSIIITESLAPKNSSADSSLRAMVIAEDKYNIPSGYAESASVLEDFVFFQPIEGVIIQSLNVLDNHHGIDIGAHSGASVKSCLDGVVIFSDWTISSGNMIIIQHNNNIISIYMHNSVLTKQRNELVKAGEVIAIVGNSGETSSGPHLHFELWQNGTPINPLEYIDF